jgi:stage III sporulation protein AD
MEIMIKCAALALTATIIGLLVKRTNPEMAILLSLTVIVVILSAAMSFGKSITELADIIRDMTSGTELIISPVLKCVGIGAITKITTDLCKDAAQSSTAAAVDMAGTLCAIGVSVPLIVSMLKMIGEMA